MKRPVHLPAPVLFFTSCLYQSQLLSEESLRALFEHCEGHPHPYAPMREYYAQEMGEAGQLQRLFFFERRPAQRQELLARKLQAVAQEEASRQGGRRVLNLDPGYLAPEHMVLATMKPYAHRPYLGEGVYLDMQYLVRAQKMVTLPWTYPDYCHHEIQALFLKMRKKLLKFSAYSTPAPAPSPGP